MKYFRQARHYYQERGDKVLHINQPNNLIVLLSFDEFICSTEEVFDIRSEEIVEIEETEFFVALDVVLMSLELPVKL